MYIKKYFLRLVCNFKLNKTLQLKQSPGGGSGDVSETKREAAADRAGQQGGSHVDTRQGETDFHAE